MKRPHARPRKAAKAPPRLEGPAKPTRDSRPKVSHSKGGHRIESSIPVAASNAAAADSRVGAEIKDLRKARGLTIAELADASALSSGYLSQIERGISSPSVKALHSISRALGVTISWFFSRAEGDDGDLRDLVVRAGARRMLTFENGIRDELLSPNLGRKLELLRSVFPPGASSGVETYAHKGEEAGFVVEGELRLWIGGKEISLGAGDSFAFSSELPHRYANPGQSETVVIWAITPPSY